jgi:hypothetical protein
MSKKDVHTVPNPGGKGWVNKVGGEVESRHRTKDHAVDRGRDIARDNKSEHAIHNKDGQISQKNSYGNDPNPPKDKNR